MAAVGPSGLGMFCWLWHLCDGGDVDAVIARCQKCGIKWLAVHTDSLVSVNTAAGESIVNKLHAAGIYVAAWEYCVPGKTSVWIQRACAVRTMGVDAVLPDLEIEWESRKDADGIVHPSDRRPEAKVFAEQLRQALGDDCWIGNAGAWQWPDRHPIYPDHAFGAQFDAGLPEKYWVMFSPTELPEAALNESDREWADKMNAGAYKALIPIGSAFDGRAQGGQALSVFDVAKFLDRYPTCALWSYQHVPADVWAMLESRMIPKS